jgi:hypothetical protein
MEMAETTIREKGQRLPRFTRVGEDVLPFRIEERDVLAWQWLYDCRFLPVVYPRIVSTDLNSLICKTWDACELPSALA